MADVDVRKEGCAGRITLTREKALNALTHEMALEIDNALKNWRDDDSVDLVLIDSAGDKAFCAGGDIVGLFHASKVGDYSLGRNFWRDEYVMNARIANYAKPVVAMMQGYVMGGGVGLGGHAAHRIVCESSRVAMPEVGIGLIPDVGGSFRLGQAPSRTGEYFGLTAGRMNGADAIYAGFADEFVPYEKWDALKEKLVETGDPAVIANFSDEQPERTLPPEEWLEAVFAGPDLQTILSDLDADQIDPERSAKIAETIREMCPLSLACTLQLVRDARSGTIEDALTREFRFTWRAQPESDFNEGVRAKLVDKDNAPKWSHPNPVAVTTDEVNNMLAPLGENELTFEEEV